MSSGNGYDMFSPEEFAKGQALAKAARAKPKGGAKPRSRRTKAMSLEPKWVWYDFKMQLAAAQQSGSCLFAVQAVIYRQHFKAWAKKEPFEFNRTLVKLTGFERHAVVRALRFWESQKWIKVDWSVRQPPLVTIRSGFHFINQ
jgi:hypothetical protein